MSDGADRKDPPPRERHEAADHPESPPAAPTTAAREMAAPRPDKKNAFIRERFLALSLESTRKSYYPQLKAQLETIQASEQRLRESEEKYRLLFEHAHDAIFVAQDGAIKFPNPKTVQLLGLDAPGPGGIPFLDLIHPEDRPRVLDTHRRRLAGDDSLPSTYTFRVINFHGHEFTVQLSAVRVQWEGRPATLNFVRDITEQVKLEASFHQAQKMEAIGTLAGGIAHDFNNLLMGIQGRASLMRMELNPAHPLDEHLSYIEEYVKSAIQLTRQLLGLARRGKYEVKTTDLNALVDKSAEMFGRTKKELRISQVLEPRLWPVEVDQGQIGQVLLNLFVNAGQAMPDGGALVLKTANVVLEEGQTEMPELPPGRYVKLSVTDTGVGMDAQTQARVFEPFFTTKQGGRGTGLGLASAYGIIRNHEGIIQVDSEKGRGSTFDIFLPASHKQLRPTPHQPLSALAQGQGTILLVDDEQMITSVGAKFLEKLGYEVITASSGQEALQIYGDQHDHIDLVILDMIMPGMSGSETFERLKGLDPDVQVLLCSGYSIDGQASVILSRGCKGFIQKPFTLEEIAGKLAEILIRENP